MQRALVIILTILVLGSLLCFAADQQVFAKMRPLQFSRLPGASLAWFQSPSPDDPYLAKFRTEYELDRVVSGKKSDYEKVRALSVWAHSRWESNGTSQAERQDAIAILDEARLGRDFRAVEYSIVLSGALNAVGIPARVVNLMMEDVATRDSISAHVVVEAYVFSLKKWVMIDPQWDVIPTVSGRPLNAVELQHALAHRTPGFAVDSMVGAAAGDYADWIAPYLFYFKVKVDGGSGTQQRQSLILLPVGARKLAAPEHVAPADRVLYTHSLSVFYPAPSMSL